MPNTDTFDFSDASQGAVADLAALAAESPSPAEAPPADAAPLSEEAVPPPSEEKEASPSEPPAPEFFEVTAAGQRLRVPKEELVKGYQRDFDYRQKTMALAEEKRILEAERTQLRQTQIQLQEVLGNPAKQAELMRQAQEQLGLPQDENEVLTLAQVKTIIRAENARLTAEIEERQRQQQYAAEVKLAESASMRELTTYAHDLMAKYPALQDVEKIDLLLLADARDAQPTSLEEVKAAMADSAARRASRLEKRVADHTKMAVVRQAKLARSTIEPPGGQTPPPSAPRTRPLKIGDSDLTAQVIADLMSGGAKR